MAELKIKIDLLQEQLNNNNFAYTIVKNGVPVNVVEKVYTSGTTTGGAGSVYKTSIDNNLPTPWAYRAFVSSLAPDEYATVIVPAFVNGEKKYYVGGYFKSFALTSSYKSLVRINENGSIDSSFSNHPNVRALFSGLTDSSTFATVRDIKVMPNGLVLVGGNFKGTNANTGNLVNGFAIFNPDGSNYGYDVELGDGLTDNGSSLFAIDYKYIDNTHWKIWLGGSMETYHIYGYSPSVTSQLLTLVNNGSLQIGIGIPSEGFDIIGSLLYSDTDNALYVGGVSGPVLQKRDVSFVLTDIDPVNTLFDVAISATIVGAATISTIAQSPNDGYLVIGGYFDIVNTQTRSSVAALNNFTGILYTTPPDLNLEDSGDYGTVSKIFVDSQDRITIAGKFNSINGITVSNLIRLQPNGDLDNTFYNGEGYNDGVIYIAQDGANMVAAGLFDTFKSLTPGDIDKIPLGGTLAQTRLNTLLNLQEFNDFPGIYYELDPNDIGGIIVTYRNFSSKDNVTVTDIVNETDYINISVLSTNYNAFPKILTRSPYYVSVPLTGDTTSALFNVKIYNGDIGNEPVNVLYPFTKNRLTVSQDTVYIDLSLLVKPFLKTNIDDYLAFPTSESIRPVGITESTWVHVEASTFANSFVVDSSEFTYLATDGFGYTEQGVNPQPPRVFIDNETDIWSEGLGKIYFLTEGLSTLTRQTVYEDGTTENVTYGTSSINTGISNQAIGSIRIFNLKSNINPTPVKNIYTFVYFGVSGTSIITKTVNATRECEYDVKEIYFKNKYGFLQTMSFLKRNDRTVNTESKTYNRSTISQQATFNSKKHTTVTYNLEATEEYTLNTGWVGEYVNETYQQMVLSDELYMNDNGIVKPITLIDRSWESKQQVNEKLINYTIKVKVAQSLINNIR